MKNTVTKVKAVKSAPFKIATVAPIKSYKDVIDAGCLKVEIIEDSSDNIHEVLGITNERATELMKICKDSFNKTNSVTDMMVIVSAQCKHANELFFTSYVTGKQHLPTGDPVMPHGFGEIMKKIMKDIHKRRESDEGAE